jgi:hypothetical protein
MICLAEDGCQEKAAESISGTGKAKDCLPRLSEIG